MLLSSAKRTKRCPRRSNSRSSSSSTRLLSSGEITPLTQKVTWGRRGSGRATRVRSGRPGGAGLRYGNGMAQRDRISVDENLLHQESEDLLALSHIQRIGAQSQLPAKSRQVFGKLQVVGLVHRGHL